MRMRLARGKKKKKKGRYMASPSLRSWRGGKWGCGLRVVRRVPLVVRKWEEQEICPSDLEVWLEETNRDWDRTMR